MPLEQALQIGSETGDLEFTAYAALNVGMKRLLIGEPLESLLEAQTRYIALLGKIKQEYQLVYAAIWQQFVLNLTTDSELGAELVGSAFNEQQMRPIFEQTNNLTSLLPSIWPNVYSIISSKLMRQRLNRRHWPRLMPKQAWDC